MFRNYLPLRSSFLSFQSRPLVARYAKSTPTFKQKPKVKKSAVLPKKPAMTKPARIPKKPDFIPPSEPMTEEQLRQAHLGIVGKSQARLEFDQMIEDIELRDKVVESIPVPPELVHELLQGFFPSEEEKLTANRMFQREVKFQMSVSSAAELTGHGPQVAFVGRSNVGKSRLINALCFNRDLAKVSREPGRTQTINVYNLAPQTHWNYLRLIDLPGYGYAKTPKTVRAGFVPMIKDYIENSPELVRVFLLVDSVAGITKDDIAMAKFLKEAGKMYQVVLTKVDKVRYLPPVLQRIEAALSKDHADVTRYPLIPTTSALKNWEIDTLRAFILEAANNAIGRKATEEEQAVVDPVQFAQQHGRSGETEETEETEEAEEESFGEGVDQK